MIDEEKSCKTSSDKTSFLLGQDRLSLYHLQKKHESQQQQQKREQKTRLSETEVTSLKSFSQMSQAEVISNSSEVDYSRCSSSTSSTFYSDNCSISSSTLTPSASSLSSSTFNGNNENTINGSFLPKKYKSDVNNNERQKQPQQMRKEHYQRVMSHKKMKHSKAIQSKGSSKLVNKRKLQGNESTTLSRQPFLDDVSLGLLRFYRAATRATMSRNHKSTSDLDKSYNMKDDNNNNSREERDVKNRKKSKSDDEMLNEGDIFYSMSPEEFVPHFAEEMVSNLYLNIKIQISLHIK